MVTRAVPALLGSACEIAFTFTVGGLGSVAGATYTPNESTVPSLLFPPGMLFTCQVTVGFDVLVTDALKIWEALGASVTDAGDTLTATAGGGGDDPPQLASNSAATAAIRLHARFI